MGCYRWPRIYPLVRTLLTDIAEVQRDVLTTNLMFSGLRADLTKAFSLNPLYVLRSSWPVCRDFHPGRCLNYVHC